MMERAYLRFWITASVITIALGAAAWRKSRLSRPTSYVPSALPAGAAVSSPASAQTPSSGVPLADPRARVRSGPPAMYHLDPARTNRSPFRGPDKPQVAWTFDAHGPIETSIGVTSGGLYVFGTLKGKVLGVSSTEHRLVFQWDAAERVYGSPLVLGKGLLVGTDASRMVRLTGSGNLSWSLETDGEVDTAAAMDSDGRIVFAAGTTLYAVRKNGSVIWRVEAKRKFYSSPAVGQDGTVFIGCQDDRLYGIDTRGRVRIKVRMAGDVDCAPAVGDDGTVFAGSDNGQVLALDGRTGRVRWRVDVGGHVRGGVTLTRRHTVVVGTYGPVPRVVSLDAVTGRVLWRFSIQGTGSREFGIHGSPVEDKDGRLFFGAQDDTLYALAPTGRLLWKMGMGGDVDAPVALVSDGVLLAGADDGRLVCVTSAGQ